MNILELQFKPSASLYQDCGLTDEIDLTLIYTHSGDITVKEVATLSSMQLLDMEVGLTNLLHKISEFNSHRNY